jgi:hypothetical protein
MIGRDDITGKLDDGVEIEKVEQLPIEGIDYDYVTDPTGDAAKLSNNPVVKLHGPFEGVVVQYGEIKLEIEETPPRLAFSFAVLNPGKNKVEDLRSSAVFKNVLGDIIKVALSDMADKIGEELNIKK